MSPSAGAKNKAYLLNLDASGNKVWEKTYGTTKSQSFYSVLPLSDGYICAGLAVTTAGKNTDIHVARIDKSGTLSWEKTFGSTTLNEIVSRIITATDGGFIILGRVPADDGNGYDVYLLKIDTAGKLVWEKKIDYGNHIECNDIKATPGRRLRDHGQHKGKREAGRRIPLEDR